MSVSSYVRMYMCRYAYMHVHPLALKSLQLAQRCQVFGQCIPLTISMPGYYCKCCGADPDDLNTRPKKCSGCQSAHYCSQRCQKAHWEAEHSKECKRLSQMRMTDPQAMDDVKTWVDSNRPILADLGWCALHAEGCSKLASHICLLFITYNGRRRAVHVESAELREFDSFQESLKGNTSLSFFGATDLTKFVAAQKIPNMFSVMAVFCTCTNADIKEVIRIVPLFFEQGFVELKEAFGLTNQTVRDHIGFLNSGIGIAGTCGKKADRVAAAAECEELLQRIPEEQRRESCEFPIHKLQDALGMHISHLLTKTLLLGNKKKSLRHTHRLQISMSREPASNSAIIEKCEAVPITLLVARQPRGTPILHAGRSTCTGESLSEMLDGAAPHVAEEAKRRDSIYLPVIIVVDRQVVVLPMFLFKSDLAEIESNKFTRQQHADLLQTTIRAFNEARYRLD